jgi:gliding motility-associated-like protein
MRIFTLCLAFVALSFLHSTAQISFWSNNGLVSLKPGAYLSIIGNAFNQDSGHYNNNDSIFVTGNFTNNAPNRCFDSIGAGWVYLYADTQHINGTSSTHFNNLILRGQGVKFGDIDVYVDDTLNLTDREFRMDTNTVWVYNPDTGAVVRTQGYVSSLQDGGLLRRTNTALPYFFAVGSDTGTFRFRPVIFQPKAANINHYKVRFANFNPTTEGFDIADKYPLVCQVNPNWYHRFYHVTGADSADITIMFDTIADGNWNDIVHWQNVPEWESIHKDNIVPGSPFFQISKYTWNNYHFSPFAIAITSDSFALATNGGPYCSYDSISLFASPNGMASYNWIGPDSFSSNAQNPVLPALGAAGIYTVTITNTYGCFQKASTTVVVNVPPNTSATNTGPQCAYTPINVTALPSGDSTYVWSGPNAYTATGETVTIPLNTTGGTYVVTVTDHNNCSASVSTVVTGYAVPYDTASNSGPYCSYDTIYLSAGTTRDSSYVWSGPDGFDTIGGYIGIPANGHAGTYTVTVTDNDGCTASSNTTVIVNAAPVSMAGVDTIIWRTDTIQLNGYGGVSGVWSPTVNLSCTECYMPYAWPDSSLYYTLTVTSNEGCKASDSIFVLVKDKPLALFFIPNVITPNGDGYNDTWVIRDLDGFPQNDVRIINRWGDEVFSQSPYQNQWGGTWNGQDLPGATYYYVLRVFYQGAWVKFDGPLTIIR